MFTTKLTNQFTASLLKAVSGVLNEAKKCEDCDCAKCECDDAEEVDEATSLGDTLKRERAGKEKKEPNGVKTEAVEELDETSAKKAMDYLSKSFAPREAAVERSARATRYNPGDRDKAGRLLRNKMKGAERAGKIIGKSFTVKEEVQDLDETAKIVAHLSKRYGDNIRKSHVMSAAKDFGVDASKLAKAVRTKLGKNMLDEKHDDVPFEGPYDKPGVRKDKYGNVIKNVAKHLAKKAMNAQKNEEVEELEEKRGLWDNIHAKRKRIKAGSSERMRKPGSEGAPTAADLKAASQTEEVEIEEATTSEKNKQHIEVTGHMGNKRLVPVHPLNAYKALNHYRGLISTKSARIVSEEVEIEEKTLTPAELTKREEIAKAMEREKPGMDKSKKMAIATAAAKRVAEAYEDDDGWYAHREMMGNKGVSKEDWKKGYRMNLKGEKVMPKSKKTSTNEAFEQIDELSKGTMGRYVNKAADRMSTQGVTAGLKIAADEKSKKNFDTIAKRQKGIATAVSKLTKEEQDFIDALNTDTLDEARGRPRKAGAKEFTINPKTKEKLMHDNPEHMKKIEALQRNGVIPVPKTEAGQHVVNQLTKAKLSMRGGETINFTHGEPHHVSGEHAAKLLTRYAGMKPDEKEAFQKKIGHSHASLKSEL